MSVGAVETYALRILALLEDVRPDLDTLGQEQDPEHLRRVYRVDHAANRARRYAENLLVTAGAPITDPNRRTTSMLDVLRAAMSVIDHYGRVQLGRMVEVGVTDSAADDVMRVLAELLDNATRCSPPTVPVVVAAHLTGTGDVLIRIEDTGIGIAPDVLADLTALLDHPPAHFHGTRLGLAIVSRLAAAHNLQVRLIPRVPSGTTALVAVPARLLCELPPDNPPPPHPSPAPRSRPATPSGARSSYRLSA
ncbi:MAG: ATP-binding protein, partial [Actinocatenispora sp.]